MPGFASPFSGNIEKKLSKTELYQALRIDIASELEAIYLYDAHAHATDDPVAKKVLADIRDEEKEHVGELLTLMNYLDPEHAKLLAEGESEVKEMMKDLGITSSSAGLTVGSLLDE